MKYTRRGVLIGSGLVSSAVSGCAGLPFVGPDLTLTLLNFDSERHFLGVEVLWANGDERSESVVLQEEFELLPPDEGDAASERREPDILESRKYVVRAHLNDSHGPTREDYLFYPDCTGNGEPNDELYVEIRSGRGGSDPYIRFSQNGCGKDSWWF